MDKVNQKEGVENKTYEFSFLVREENSINNLHRLLGQHGIQVQAESSLKKINLAYKIKHVAEAYFGFFRLFAAPATVQSLVRDLRNDSSILRFLTVALPAQRKESIGVPPKQERPQPKRAISSRETMQPKPLSNEALEKKIEEILQ